MVQLRLVPDEVVTDCASALVFVSLRVLYIQYTRQLFDPQTLRVPVTVDSHVIELVATSGLEELAHECGRSSLFGTEVPRTETGHHQIPVDALASLLVGLNGESWKQFEDGFWLQGFVHPCRGGSWWKQRRERKRGRGRFRNARSLFLLRTGTGK